jgi:hypothetical protein
MPETANQVEIENSHIQSQQLENTLVTAKFKKLNRTVVMPSTKSACRQAGSNQALNNKHQISNKDQTAKRQIPNGEGSVSFMNAGRLLRHV